MSEVLAQLKKKGGGSGGAAFGINNVYTYDKTIVIPIAGFKTLNYTLKGTAQHCTVAIYVNNTGGLTNQVATTVYNLSAQTVTGTYDVSGYSYIVIKGTQHGYATQSDIATISVS